LQTLVGAFCVEGLDALDVSANLDTLTLDGSVAANTLDVLVVGLGRGETSESGLSVFHVCIISGLG
jgi:hypothetical protein